MASHRMIRLAAGVVLGGALSAAGMASAQTPAPNAGPQPPQLRGGQAPQRDAPQRDTQNPAQPAAPLTLPQLLDRLKEAKSPEEAQGFVRQIARRWSRSGSDTSDLLMQRAKEALARQQAPLAVELLDRVLAIHPDWAEAWHTRGMAFFIIQDDFRAIGDFREALRREPRHFMALGMTAAALQRQGDEKGALRAFRAVQELNPHFDGVKAAIDRLQLSVDGRDA